MRDVDLPLVPVLAGMELAGVSVDTAFLGRLAVDYGREAERLRQSVWAAAGVEFNLDSPKQVGEVLFERLGLRKGRRTKTGYSTDERTLLALAVKHEVAGLILSYRQLMKLKAGYLDALPRLVNPKTRARPHDVQPGRGRDGAALEQQPEPPEHPDQDGARAGRSERRSWRARAAGSCRPTTRRSSSGSWPTSPATTG